MWVPGKDWCLRWIADDKSLVHAELGKSTGYPRTETTSRARHSERGLGSDHQSTAAARRSIWSSVATVGSKYNSVKPASSNPFATSRSWETDRWAESAIWLAKSPMKR